MPRRVGWRVRTGRNGSVLGSVAAWVFSDPRFASGKSLYRLRGALGEKVTRASRTGIRSGAARLHACSWPLVALRGPSRPFVCRHGESWRMRIARDDRSVGSNNGGHHQNRRFASRSCLFGPA
jgi:hypothetical protein